jgi:HK97 gp10 family phage protein
VSAVITGQEELKRVLLSLGRDMEQALAQGVFLTAQQIRTHAIKSIQEQGFGSYVQRSRQGGGTYTHIAAAPGKAPNTDTGKLVSSIAVEMDWDDASAEVGSNLDYSAFLEFGTTQMEPRPWLSPAVDAKRDNMQKNIAKAAINTIKKKAKR